MDVFNNNLKAAQEAGNGGERVAYGKTHFTQMFFRTGTDFRNRTQHYTINSGIYYAYDMNGAELKTHVWDRAEPDLKNAPLAGTKLGDSLLMFNFGIDLMESSDFAISFGYQGEYAIGTANDSLRSVVHVGLFGRW
jgi:hypothetical protein